MSSLHSGNAIRESAEENARHIQSAMGNDYDADEEISYGRELAERGTCDLYY